MSANEQGLPPQKSHDFDIGEGVTIIQQEGTDGHI